MRLLFVSHLFKNPLEHSKLPHLADLVRELSKDVDLEVVAPVPWAPPFIGPARWRRLAQIPRDHRYGKVRVRYPRHFVLPGRLAYERVGRSFLRTLRKTLAGETYDLVWAHYAYPDGWAAVELARERGVPSIVTVRGEDVRTDVEDPRVRRLVEQALREASVVTSPHPETTELARALGRKDVVELHNGVDVARFSSGDGAKIRGELGLADEFVVTFVGHLVAFKDPSTFIRAAALIPETEQVAFLVVGSEGRGKEQTDLRGLAARLGVSSRVKFLGDREDVPDILAASNVFVALSPTENIWSNTLLEAMAARVACIVTRVGTTERFLHHGKDAWLIPPQDPRALADAIVGLKTDPGAREGMVRGAEALVTAEFDLRAIAPRALALCRSLAAR